MMDPITQWIPQKWPSRLLPLLASGLRCNVRTLYSLEPIMDVEVVAPSEMLGDVVGDLNSHRARILGMDSLDENTVRISAHVPMAEMFRYATTLRSITQGRGSYSMHLLGYEEALPLVAHQVAAAYQKAREAKEH